MPRSERRAARTPAATRAAPRRTERADKEALLKRLKRVGGQIEGIGRMLAEDRYCIDVLTQIAAARSALDALGLELLRGHASGCVRHAVRSGDGERAIEELMEVVERLAR